MVERGVRKYSFDIKGDYNICRTKYKYFYADTMVKAGISRKKDDLEYSRRVWKPSFFSLLYSKVLILCIKT